nr:RNA polymerase I subunit RPA135 [Paratrimastix eleionoma]
MSGEKLDALWRPHIDSFNFFCEEGLQKAVSLLRPKIVESENHTVEVWLEDAKMGVPMKPNGGTLYPRECRMANVTYSAPLFVDICRRINGGEIERIQRRMAEIPIMVKSSHCNLANRSPEELIKLGEEPHERGGYFIIHGLERLLRLIIMPRKNCPMAMNRGAYTKRGHLYTNFGVQIRCARPDQTSQTIVLHYLSDGTATARFSIRRQEFFIPVVLLLRCFRECTDKEVFEAGLQGDEENSFMKGRLEAMIRQVHQIKCYTMDQSLAYLGSRFRAVLRYPASWTDVQCGTELLHQFIFVHLDSNQDKFNLLIFMLRKLCLLADGKIVPENSDSAEYHELLQGGHLMLMCLKEQLDNWTEGLKRLMQMEISKGTDITPAATYRKMIDRVPVDVGKRLDYLLATGNLRTESGLDLMQVTGYSIVAERLNFLRFVSHFRSVHRGHFFTEMKTTAVRKLRPEGWGFFCPVHTPDGAPCGLLTHLAAECQVVSVEADTSRLPELLTSLGMIPVTPRVPLDPSYVPCMLDGRILGFIKDDYCGPIAERLRYLKSTDAKLVSPTLEIALIPPSLPYQMPALYLFSSLSRLMRPVRYLPTGAIQLIGTLEQSYLEVACLPSDITPRSTHMESNPTSILSLVANLTPFSDFNQSPRNMYQCQMGKQTMGTPFLNAPYRWDNKVYKIQTPQWPIARTKAQDEYGMDEYPTGTNACVAVISYTGYDMEDGMIVNKASYERGFAHASVYLTKNFDLYDDEKKMRIKKWFSNKDLHGNPIRPNLDSDGIIAVGSRVQKGDALCAVVDELGEIHVNEHKISEPAYVDAITLIGKEGSGEPMCCRIKLRLNRNPVIGDKFSSRHGQKGVLSMLWPQVDMPFTENGITPDCIINPHAFPSRMTIGMLIECMAGKSGSCHGRPVDASAFQFNRNKGLPGQTSVRAIDFVGAQLVKAGFNYYGTEPLYSGVTGEELKAEIFFGVVFYQRLRHMVSDKFQVRTTGAVHALTHQPIKGRKVGGGIRLGEMERDSLLGHGTSFLLHDRLMHCSDEFKGLICTHCGSLISVLSTPTSNEVGGSKLQHMCRTCGTGRYVGEVTIPYVLKYLVNELAGMNIRLTLDTNLVLP